MMHRAWSSIVEVPYCFSRSYVKLQGHMALKIIEFDPNWGFPDCNSGLNSPMAMKCCTKLETAKERCPIVFHGHPSNFKVTRDKASPILTQIGRFRTIPWSQLSNPSDLPCCVNCCRKLQYHVWEIWFSRVFFKNVYIISFTQGYWFHTYLVCCNKTLQFIRVCPKYFDDTFAFSMSSMYLMNFKHI